MYLLVNGEVLARNSFRVDVEDRGYQFGDGVYEVIRVYQQECFALWEHLQRLERSAREIQLELPLEKGAMATKLQELLRREGVTDGAVYLQVTRGVAPRNHAFPEQVRPLLTAYAYSANRPEEEIRHGICAVTLPDLRWLRCDIKSLNLLGAVMAKEKAKQAGVQEALLVRDGYLTEGSSTNLFAVRQGVLYTHPANHLILNGITRQIVILLAQQAGISVKEEAIAASDLSTLDELFITSTTYEVCPVVEVNGYSINSTQPGPITRYLQKAFEALLPQGIRRIG